MVKLCMIMQHIILCTLCITFMLVSHTCIIMIDHDTCIIVIDHAEQGHEEPLEPAPIECDNYEQDQGKPDTSNHHL
jgi:hypothetical protein